MEKRNSVLMICYYLPPYKGVGGLRSSKFIKYLPEFGWSINVITAYNAKGMNSEAVKVYYVPNVDIKRVLYWLREIILTWKDKLQLYVRLFKSKVKKTEWVESYSVGMSGKNAEKAGFLTEVLRYLLIPDPQFLWIFIAVPIGVIVSRRVDVIYSSVLPWTAHIVGFLVSKLTGKPLILDYRDEWTLNMNWFPPTKFHRWLGDKLDRACIKQAKYVINVSEARTELFRKHFSDEPEEKFITIHNGFDEDDVAPFRTITPPQTPLIMTSIGNLYGGRNPKGLILALKDLLCENDDLKKHIQIKLIGDIGRDIVELVQETNLTDIVKIHPRIPQPQALEILSRSHIALLIGGQMEKVAMTTKIYEYMGLYKPVFALVPEGQLKEFVLKYGGWVANPDNVEEIEQRLEEILVCYEQGLLKNKVNREMVSAYTRRSLSAQLHHILEESINA